MKIKYFSILIIAFASLLHSCSSGKRLSKNASEGLQEITLDPLVVVPEKNWNDQIPTQTAYKSSPTRKNDLLHMDLSVSFDRAQRSVSGTSRLTLSPLFYPTSILELDAKDFEIHRLALAASNKELPYKYDGSAIQITLDRIYQRNDTYEIIIDYTAFPERSFAKNSGVIQSDKGLFFIDPDESIPDVPTQIWSQGETEHNSNWFPTIDRPNERATQDIRLRVEDRFQTLSNGVLVSSEKHNDGFRTDHWQLMKPHAPYLVVVAVGEFASYKTSWNGMELNYLAEPEYEQYLPIIYEHTPEMLTFFSQRFGVPYVWPAFNQLVVRDFVSGAMENTTAIVYSQMVQRTDKSLKDYDNDKIIAHEMSHHWFGNLVTCESWANIPLNEGFANYSEYLWLENKYGRQEADLARHSEISAYFQESYYKARPLVKYDYSDAEKLFDAHSYNKGGLVLHMLRRFLGEEAFFLSLKKYLDDNSFNSVETDHLRLACESVSGMDLNWFFDQWYGYVGHPVLNISYEQPNENELVINIDQVQDSISWASEFILPVEFDIYLENGEKIRKTEWVKNRKESFSFPVTDEVRTLEFDPENSLLASISFTREIDEARLVFMDDASFQTRLEAFEQLGDLISSDDEIIKKCLEDPFWYWRMTILEELNTHSIQDWEEKIKELAKNDPNSRVRAAALYSLASTGDKENISILESAIDSYYSNNVLQASLEGLFYLDSTLAVEKAKSLDILNEPQLYPVISFIYTAYGDPKNIPYMEKYLDKVVGYGAIQFFENYALLLSKTKEHNIIQKAEELGSLGKDKNQSPWRKIGVIKSLTTLMNLAAKAGMLDLNEALSGQVQGVLEAEENPQVISIMRSMIME